MRPIRMIPIQLVAGARNHSQANRSLEFQFEILADEKNQFGSIPVGCAPSRESQRRPRRRSTAMIQARKLGHIVLKVRDAQKSKEF